MPVAVVTMTIFSITTIFMFDSIIVRREANRGVDMSVVLKANETVLHDIGGLEANEAALLWPWNAYVAVEHEISRKLLLLFLFFSMHRDGNGFGVSHGPVWYWRKEE